MPRDVDAAPGWFGKLPCLGDFATRRLPRDFVQPWDAWLRRVLHASRGRLGGAWLDTYLACPLWRFVLPPGACGPQGWAGVLMPSLDAAGRAFPFAVARMLPAGTARCTRLRGDDAWYAAVEDAMLLALERGDTTDALDARLRTLPAPADAPPLPAGEGLRLPAGDADAADAWPARVDALAADAAAPWTWWRSVACGDRPARRLAVAGLPADDVFASLLDGSAGAAADAPRSAAAA